MTGHRDAAPDSSLAKVHVTLSAYMFMKVTGLKNRTNRLWVAIGIRLTEALGQASEFSVPWIDELGTKMCFEGHVGSD